MTLIDESISVHMTVNTLALRRGGLVGAVIRRANALAESGKIGNVWIEVLGVQPWLDADVATLKESGKLHSDVGARSVLRALDRSATTASARGAAMPKALDGHRVGVDSQTTDVLRDGVLLAVERRERDGRLRQVDHYSPAAVRTQREEYGPDGNLVRVLEFTPVGQIGAERVIGRDGGTFLTIHHAGGSPKWTRAYLEGHRVFLSGSIGEIYAEAFTRLLWDEVHPIVTSEFRENLNNLPDMNLDDVIQRIRHPNLRRVAVGHSNHHAGAPYDRGASIVANWRRFFESASHWDELTVSTSQQRDDLMAELEPDLPITAIPLYAPPPASEVRAPDYSKVLLVSRIHRKKRVDEAIRVMRSVVNGLPQARLDFFGFGYGDDEEQKIRDLVDALELGSQVNFAGFTPDLGEIYDDAAVTLVTSQSEGFNQVLLESMARGVPVVAFDCSYGPRDVIEDGVNGYLHDFGDKEAAAQSIIRILTDSELRRHLSEGALRTASRFSQDRFTESWVRLCHDVVSRPGKHIFTVEEQEAEVREAHQSSDGTRRGRGLVGRLTGR